ncbi:MAG: VirB3 family type IV secretion system protein [Proteobacteria bacterium]|nr:VirB3 family type IV secretion system protein [Pseudomonadota bacterium]
MRNKVEGFEIPLHRSLTEPILIAGVPRIFAILNFTFCAALVLGYKSWYIIPITIVLHLAAVFLTKKDADFFSILRCHISDKNLYVS